MKHLGGSHVKISVIMAAYNSEAYIRQCIDSILRQTYQNFELIIVNDGSSDHTEEIIRSYISAGENRIRLFRTDHIGAGGARNAGLDHAEGDYYLILDSDDYFEPQFFEVMLDGCERTGAEISVARGKSYDARTGAEEDLWYAFRKDFFPKDNPFTYSEAREHIFTMFLGWAWDKMFSADLIRRNHLRFQEIPSSNDVYFVFMALVLSNRIYTIDQSLVHYRINDPSSTSNNRHITWNCFYQAMIEIKKSLISDHIYPMVEKAYLNWCADFIFSQLRSLQNTSGLHQAYDLLRNTGFDSIGIFDHDESYFYFLDGYHFCVYVREHDYYSFINRRADDKSRELEKRIESLQKQNDILTARNQSLSEEITSLKKSASFRIGRRITYLPRKIRNHKKN